MESDFSYHEQTTEETFRH